MPLSDQEASRARAHLNNWLRYHMAATGLDQQALARRLGVTKGLITQWFTAEGAKGLPSFYSLLAIAKELDLPLDILLSRDPPSR